MTVLQLRAGSAATTGSLRIASARLQRGARWLACGIALATAWSTQGFAQTADIKLWRMQCGKDQPLPKAMFSDAFRYPEESTKDFTFSCYLIQHGQDYLVWDAGLPDVDGPRITQQLRQLGLTPKDVRFLGISHYHFDHIGQAADFAEATLLIGADDFAAVKKGDRLPDNSTTSGMRLAPWIVGGGKVELLSQDHDVFGDGLVRVLRMPGHTPGHRALLVTLPKKGPVLLSGDLYHFPENRHFREVPAFNTDRAQTQASMQRFEEIASRLKAQVIIQHEPADIAKLPAFPAAAE
ncbi:MAG: hypothetical protein RLZZ200_994 [Pseudomonadota bacterium]|jgi:glyoxylase-like metal-dependent hydrolase (beta-lactamase superfamily II)